MVNLAKSKISFLVVITLIKIYVFYKFNSNYIEVYYRPFLSQNFSILNYWDYWLNYGGRSDSFPYGLGLFIPLKFFQIISNFINFPLRFAFGLAYLVIDLIILYQFRRLSLLNIFFYALNPVIFYVTYIEGQTDIIVGFVVLLFAIFLKKGKYIFASISLGIAIGCKLSAILVIPFLVVFFLDNPKFKRLNFLISLRSLVIGSLFYLPAIWSRGFRKMVLETPEISRLFDFSIDLNVSKIYIFPAIYVTLLLWVWKTGKSSIDFLLIVTGVGLFALPIFSSSWIGWQLWTLPLLFFIGDFNRQRDHFVLFTINFLTLIRAFDSTFLEKSDSSIVVNTLNSLNTVILVLTSFWLLNSITRYKAEAITRYNSFDPTIVTISGDSGVGKDFLSDNLIRVLGTDSAIKISGDSYHKYERGSIALRSTTLLNPEQNDLNSWKFHLDSLRNRSIFQTRNYDHAFGRFTEWKLSRKKYDFVVSQGLHANYGIFNDVSDLKLHLIMNEKLRIELKLKRDSNARNQNRKKILSEIQRRRRDGIKYIDSQNNLVDIILSIDAKSEISDKRQFFYTLVFKNVILFEKLMDRIRQSQNHFLGLDIDFTEYSISLAETSFEVTSISQFLENSLRNYNDFLPIDFKLENAQNPLLIAIIILTMEINKTNRTRLRLE